MRTSVHTDGSCIGNPGPGGWAWAVDQEHNASGFDSETTNNRMEIRAVIEAIKSVEGDLQITSDSKYVVDCIQEKWYLGWLKRGWFTKQNQPVMNRDLWEELLTLLHDRDVEFVWVKGHNGDEMNEFVDGLARQTAEGGRAWCGTCGSVDGSDPRPLRSRRAEPCGAHR